MRPSLVVRYSLAAGLALFSALAGLHAQVPGRNVNMASGQEWPGGDPFLQRQNEPSVAVSTRNPLHVLAGVNDYRTVDLPRSDESTELGDAWLGLFTSTDGGQRWSSTLVPGYPQDESPEGTASPLKGYAAGADPVVRAGNSGLMYYAGLAFDRGATGKSAIFVSRFIDNNNKESGDPFAYLGTSLLETRTGVDSYFVDKPWMAVDIPRSTSLRCTIDTPGEGGTVIRQTVPAGAVYVAYTLFQRDASGEPVRSDIFLRRSINCGATWDPPIRVSNESDTFSQGPVLAVDPASGEVYVAYRRFSLPGGVGPDVDGILLTRVNDKKKFPPGLVRKLTRRLNDLPLPERFGKKTKVKGPVGVDDVTEFDQGSSASELAFRTNAYPTMTFDGTGRVYIAWSERGFATAPGTNPSPTDGDARVVLVTAKNGKNFTDPVVVDDSQPGHQIMPSLTFAGGRLMLIYYDVRETRAQVFGKFIKDLPYAVVDGVEKRQTIDIRASMATPGATPVFGPSVKVSDYMVGKRPGSNQVEQLQVNPPNLPLFRQGTTPFMGDYIDVAAAPSMVPLANGRWGFNTAASQTLPVFHAVWTDNRDVRPPADGNWANYTPPIYTGSALLELPVCTPGQTGMRNQNPYTTRITGELVVGSPGNHKTLSPTLQRSFVVFAQNTRTQTKYFRMTILAQPPGGRASFKQFPLPPYTTASEAPLTVVDVSVPARSTAVRTVYVTSSDPNAQIAVDVSEIAAVGAPAELAGGAEGRIVLNPDIDNPDIDNPDIDNPDIDNPDIDNPDIDNAEVHNPDIDNPDIDNPDIDNPDIDNPDIDNPDIDNPDIDNLTIANPDIDNPDIDNPEIDNPDIDNPDIDNPDIDNPDIDNSALTDLTWRITNTGNTTTGYNVNLFLTQAIDPALLKTQLILHKSYKTPVSDGCSLKFETRNVIVSSIPNPTFITPTTPGGVIDPNDPSATNATLWLAPGETGKITLRVLNKDKNNPNTTVTVPCGSGTCSIPAALVPNEKVTPGIVSQPVGSEDAGDGVTEPPVVTPSGTNMYFIQSPTSVVAGAAIAPAVSVQVRDGAGVPVPGASVTLAFGSNPEGATLTGAGPVSTDASGIATFPALSVSAAGAGYTLVATATGFEGSVVSVPFNVTTSVATAYMSFEQQPSAGTAGVPITPTVSVRAYDDAEHALSGVEITLTLVAPGGALLSGNVAVTDVGGIATFPDLTVSAAGAGYTLVATATGFDGSRVSESFNVASGGPLTATVSFVGLGAIYDGSPKGVSATTAPFGLGTSVTYNGSPTAPSAIGAYAVLGTVTEPGYVGSASATHLIASTIQAGGFGGGPYGPLYCGPGVFANGISAAVDGSPNEAFGYIGYALTSGRLVCSDGNHPVKFGGGTTPNADLSCPSGEVMVGIFGTTGGPGFNVVTSVGARCQLPSGGAINEVGPLPGGGTPFGPIDCPAGQAVTGVVGGQGAVVDSIALVCSPPAALAGRWSADGTGADSSGNGYDVAPFNGATYGPGRVGQAFSFDSAQSQYMMVAGNPANLQTASDVTMAAWIYPTSDTNYRATIVLKEGEYQMARGDNGNIWWGLSTAAGYNWTDSGVPVPVNEWSHVVVTHGAGVVRTYLNGVLAATSPSPGNIVDYYPSNNELFIGGRVLWPEPFDGQIDEVVVYNGALSAADVAALHAAAGTIQTVTVTLSGLLATYDGTPKAVSVTTSEPVTYSVTYNGSETVPSDAGSYAVVATVTQAGYTGVASDTLTIDQATPVVTWASPGAITYGTALSGAELNATTSVPGSLAYTPTLGTVLNAGTQTLSVTFTPTDTANYTTATETVSLTVSKATPTVTWGNTAIAVGTPLGQSELNAVASVPGAFVYTPAAGTVLPVGTYGLSMTFTPTDAANFETVTGTVTLTVVGPAPGHVLVPAVAGGLSNTNCLPSCDEFPLGPGGTAAVSTGVNLSAGSSVTLTATGQVIVGGSNPGPYGPSGTGSAGTYWPQWRFLATSVNQFSLVARIGTGPWQYVGPGPTTVTAAVAGELQLAVNDSQYSDNSGWFDVTIGGTISSVSPNPAGWAFAQAITVSGTNLPAGGSMSGPTFPREIENQVVITQAGVDYVATEVFVGGTSTWILMLPNTLAPGAATIRLKNVGGTTTTNAFPITVSATPSAPIIHNVFNATGDTGFTTTPVTSLTPGAWLTIEADGVSTSAYLATYVFTPASGAGNAKTSSGYAANVGGSSGGIRHTVQIPADLDVSSWVDVQVYLFGPSPLSNAVRIGTAITSVSPEAQVAPGQMLTIYGVNLQATDLNDVLFNQGGGDIPAQYVWGADATRVTARLPALTPGVPTTVRLKNPSGTVTTSAFPIAITNTPGTPVLTSLLNQCSGGTPITTVTPGGQFAVEGEGIDTSGTTLVWTPITAVGSVITQTGTSSTGGPTGRVCSYFPFGGAPAGLTSGTWNLQLRVTVGGFTSTDSNAVVVTVP